VTVVIAASSSVPAVVSLDQVAASVGLQIIASVGFTNDIKNAPVEHRIAVMPQPIHALRGPGFPFCESEKH
jgi:hypothetical protein